MRSLRRAASVVAVDLLFAVFILRLPLAVVEATSDSQLPSAVLRLPLRLPLPMITEYIEMFADVVAAIGEAIRIEKTKLSIEQHRSNIGDDLLKAVSGRAAQIGATVYHIAIGPRRMTAPMHDLVIYAMADESTCSLIFLHKFLCGVIRDLCRDNILLETVKVFATLPVPLLILQPIASIKSICLSMLLIP
jgi:hypothetical protein